MIDCPIVEFIATTPGRAERLLADQQEDAAGRCRLCSAGAQAARVKWPCRIHDYARRAAEAERRD